MAGNQKRSVAHPERHLAFQHDAGTTVDPRAWTQDGTSSVNSSMAIRALAILTAAASTHLVPFSRGSWCRITHHTGRRDNRESARRR